MCKVIQYQFTCGHYIKQRSSRCGGTRSKETRTSRKAACSAEPYISIKLSFGCNECQLGAWVARWKARLERARTFRNGLLERRLLGAEGVSELVRGLEEEYAVAAWNLKNVFPHTRTRTVGRVKPVREEEQRRREHSLLSHEVRPDEVVLSTKNNQDQGDEDSSDQLTTDHSCSAIPIDYTHPLEHADDSWVYDQFTEEELQSPPDVDAGFDPTLSGWEWGGDSGGGDDRDDDAQNLAPLASEIHVSTNLTACGPRAEPSSSASHLGLEDFITNDQRQQSMIDESIKTFWEVVNLDSSDSQQFQRPSMPLIELPDHQFQHLSLASSPTLVGDRETGDSGSNASTSRFDAFPAGSDTR